MSQNPHGGGGGQYGQGQGYPPQQQGYPQHQQPQQQYTPEQQQYAQQQYAAQQQQYAAQQQGLQPAAAAAASGQLSAKGQQMINSFIDLLPEEKIEYAVEADGLLLGAHPILKLFAKLQGFFITITGGHVRVFLVVTNKRLIMMDSRQVLCGYMATKKVNAVALASVLECNSGKESQVWCFHTRSIGVETKTQKTGMLVKKLGDAQVKQFLTKLSAVLVENAESGRV